MSMQPPISSRLVIPGNAKMPLRKFATRRVTGEEEEFNLEDLLNPSLDELYGTTVPTRTQVPEQKGTTVITTRQRGEQPLSQSLSSSIDSAQGRLSGTYEPEAIERAMAGDKAQSFWERAAFGTLNYFVLKPLQTVDTGRRLIVSGLREGIDIFDPKRDASFKDFWKQLTDVNLSSKDVFNINTGNKWVDNIVGFGLDVALDPTTYLTLGTGTAAKVALQQATKSIAGDVTQRIVSEAAQDIATRGVKNVTDDVARKFATELGEAATKKEIRVASRAAVAEAAQIARQSGTINDNLLNQAISRYSAVGPRRGIGAAKREATANAIRETRDAAVREAAQFAGTAQGRRAQQFVDTITDDVIADIATKGFSAMRGDIAKQLGVKGGFRYNLPGVRTSVRGTEFITNPIGRAASFVRRGVAGFEVAGSPLARVITPRGMSQAVWDARTGLRTGGFETTQETLRALDILSKDAQFRGFVNAAKQAIKPARMNFLKKGDATLAKSVYQLLDPKINLDAPIADIAKQINRPLTQKEVDFAKEFVNLIDEFETAVGSTGATITYRGANRNVFPQMLTENAQKFLQSADKKGQVANNARTVLDNLGMPSAPLPGQTVDIAPGKKFFDTVLPEDIEDFNKLGIEDFNEMARQGGFKGNFFETNVITALDKYIRKYADDYALASMISYNTRQVANKVRPALLAGDPVAQRLFNISEGAIAPGTLDDIIASNKLEPWAVEDLVEGQRAINAAVERALKTETDDVLRESVIKAQAELDELFRVLKNSIDSGDDIADAWTKLATDLQANYATLFSLPKTKVLNTLRTLGPQELKTMVKLGEDAFVALDSYVVPNALVRADLADVFKNIKRLNQPKVGNQALEFWKGIQNSVRTWYTTTPGFHTRNYISNWFQMIAGGGNFKYLREGLDISNKWNEFLKEEAELRGGLLRNPGELVQRFFETADIPKNQRAAAEEALLSFGAAGFGDLEDVFGGAASRAIGITGREATGVVPLTRGRVQSETLRKVSTATGALPRLSRNIGERTETQARFIFTYDAMRQGLTPDEAIARTSKFLVDYTDLSQLDEVARQFIPFWMWMSRNLPTQLVNIYTSPGLYQKYNNFRRNFEDKNGDNLLVPDYIEKAGQFIVGRTPLGAVTLKPDFGFPGAGTPSPLQEAVAAPETLLQSANPIIRNLVEQLLLDREVFANQPLETTGQRIESGVEAAVPQLSFLQRTLNPLVAGTDIPVLRDIPGIYSSTTAGGLQKESPDNLVKLQALASFLGLPAGFIGPNQENAARFQQLERLGASSRQTEAEQEAALQNLEELNREVLNLSPEELRDLRLRLLVERFGRREGERQYRQRYGEE